MWPLATSLHNHVQNISLLLSLRVSPLCLEEHIKPSVLRIFFLLLCQAKLLLDYEESRDILFYYTVCIL